MLHTILMIDIRGNAHRSALVERSGSQNYSTNLRFKQAGRLK